MQDFVDVHANSFVAILQIRRFLLDKHYKYERGEVSKGFVRHDSKQYSLMDAY